MSVLPWTNSRELYSSSSFWQNRENFDSESQDYGPIEMICFVLPSLTFKKVNGYVHEPKPNN